VCQKVSEFKILDILHDEILVDMAGKEFYDRIRLIFTLEHVSSICEICQYFRIANLTNYTANCLIYKQTFCFIISLCLYFYIFLIFCKTKTDNHFKLEIIIYHQGLVILPSRIMPPQLLLL
jgi:hypothetical protein